MNQAGSTIPADAPGVAQVQRADARWDAAVLLQGANTSVWRLERVKAIAERQEPQRKQGSVSLPKPNAGIAMLHRIAFFVTAIIALCGYAVYILLYCLRAGPQTLPANAKRIVAVHGEWSTRTKHMLSELPQADPSIDAIVLLGRQSQNPEDIRPVWTAHVPSIENIPVISPVSLKAALAAFRDMITLLRGGMREAAETAHLLGLREEIAIAYRVYLGATQARWWKQQKPAQDVEALFASTGTADTTLLELAIQQTGGRTVHLVHGQAIGPNFAGMSDFAIFKSRFDAQNYEALKCYGKSAVQASERPDPKRGSEGVLLLTNLAHPMNPGFRRYGIRDEVNLLELVRRAADLLALNETPLLWKPHPVTYDLEPRLVENLREAAKSLGFEELPRGVALADAAATARWTISSPSTVAIELLEAGWLSVVLDPQQTIGATALSAFPGLSCLQPEAMAELMAKLDRPNAYNECFDTVYSAIGPAGPLDLTARLC